MDILSTIYNDPLFSIIIIILIIVTIAIADYTRNKYKMKTKQEALNTLAKNYSHHGVDENAIVLFDISKYPIPTLTFIAKIYVANGNFDEAIKIYLSILEKTQDYKEKMKIFELLGLAYYKAGFMQRAKDIFIKILKNNPRNKIVLLLLMQTCENLGEYQNALDAVSCLEELEQDVKNLRDYILVLMIINDSLMPLERRESKILQIKTTNVATNRVILNFLKSYNINTFWKLIVKYDSILGYIDILWHISNPELELFRDHKEICDVYRARGIINDNESCDTFELEVLRIMNKHSNRKATLEFKYKCKACQSVYPFEISTCPTCNEFGNISLKLEIMENNNEKNFSLL